ncbi:GntR family transcriptional regulator [Rhodococcus sp. HM1]|uniref:GntR family transcriptional regulator n=1 Tax=Rhodococcus sp. HM1 TaxID=2937759 RepID=UPI002009FA9F|nr:GntR family transcriptional regulator [Rhodococcus sp. HM1]MCK8671559.1 GntR family transcriptional regulator [Rhodococcus sp. HM1]
MTTETAKRPTAVQRAVEAIREGVRVGRFVPGQRLIEPDLMQELGVGRNALREALAQLGSDGLVKLEPHRGASIRRLTREDVAHFYQVREVLEGLSARLAAQNIDAPGHRERVLSAIDKSRSIAAAGDQPTYFDENFRFHRIIVELSGNPRLIELTDRLETQTFRLQFRSAKSNFVDYSIAEHEEIAEAILAGDGNQAEDLMRAHLRHTCSDILKLPTHDFA